MGGCCSSSTKPHLHGPPLYYYCPPTLEENESLTSHNGAASAFTAGLLVHLDLETSIPDTYRAPPPPLPYDLVIAYPQSTDSKSVSKTVTSSSFETLATSEDLEESDSQTQTATLPASPQKLEPSSNEFNVPAEEEEDACPICLEEYDGQNPKMTTKCEHNFHLSCILEWMERSDTCPICDQEMVFDH